MFLHTSKILRYIVIVLILVVVFAVLQLKGLTGWLTKVLVVLPQPIASPLQSAASSMRRGVDRIGSIRTLYVENAELKSRVQELEGGIARLEGVQKENEMLKGSLGFAAKPPVAIVPCTVVGRDPEGITQTLLLSCGSSQGVAVGQGVVASGYLIGQVILVSNSTATVKLLTAPSIAVDVSIATRRLSGVLKGSYGSGMLLDFIPQTAEVAKGDIVTTAGINSKIPPDVLVGSVSEVVKEPSALFYKLTVTNPVDLRDLRYVHVLKP